VTPLAPHPNDAHLPPRKGGAEALTTFTIAVPDGTAPQLVADTEAREAQRAAELAEQGQLLRLWRLPGEARALGLWHTSDPAELPALLRSLPMDPWMTVQTIPLAPHPSDPALAPA
jgi:muconolactone delta-isomerase